MAATISVDGTSCTLSNAITAANNDAPTGGCAAGSGGDVIELPPGNTPLTTALPGITSNIMILGNFPLCGISRITRDSSAPEFGILAVAPSGNLTLECTTVSGGAASTGVVSLTAVS